MKSIARLRIIARLTRSQDTRIFAAGLALACFSLPNQLWSQTTMWNTNGASTWYAPANTSVGIGTNMPGGPLTVSYAANGQGQVCSAPAGNGEGVLPLR
jgi:hypothetical protein